MRKALPLENPILAAEWDFEKNGNMRPEDFTGGSNKKVWWRCEKGHSWLAEINKRFTFGRGCPYCSGNKVWPGFNDLITTHPLIAAEWDHKRNGKLRPEQFSIGADVKIWWKCKHGHRWQALLYSRKNCGCPVCARNTLAIGVNDLQTLNPLLALEWDTSKNGGRMPDSVAANANRKAWWLCDKGHSWQAEISSRNSGKGCPYCTNRKLLAGFNDLSTVAPELAMEWDYERNDSLRPEDVLAGSHKSVWWICSRGHRWKAKISQRRLGSGCPYDAGKLVICGETDLKTRFPALCGEWDHKKNGQVHPETIACHSHKSFWWRCSKGHSYRSTVANRAKGNGCPYCAGKRPIVGETDFRSVHPELMSEWDFEKNGRLLPEDIVAYSHKMVWWHCEYGHSWKTMACNRHIGHGCPVCNALADHHPVIAGVTDLTTLYPFIAEEWDDERNGDLKPNRVLPHSTRAVWWKCKRGHHWKSKIQTRIKGTGCPYCRGRTPMRTRLVI
jgi:hypothetical protein